MVIMQTSDGRRSTFDVRRGLGGKERAGEGADYLTHRQDRTSAVPRRRRRAAREAGVCLALHHHGVSYAHRSTVSGLGISASMLQSVNAPPPPAAPALERAAADRRRLPRAHRAARAHAVDRGAAPAPARRRGSDPAVGPRRGGARPQAGAEAHGRQLPQRGRPP